MLVRLSILLLLLLCACSKESSDTVQIEEIKQDGITISISPSTNSLRTCDLLELSVTATYPQNFKIKLPDSKSQFGDFQIFQIHQNSPVAINEQLNSLTQVIILEPGLPSDHKLPALKFTYWNQKNEEKNLFSKESNFKVVSSINPAKHTEIEDIITSTKKSTHLVTIIGSLGILVTLIYLLFFSKAEETSKSDPRKETLKQLEILRNSESTKIIKELPSLCCLFLKQCFSLETSANNLDVLIQKLPEKETSEVLSELLQDYNSLRYGKNESSDKAQYLLDSFASVFKKCLETSS